MSHAIPAVSRFGAEMTRLAHDAVHAVKGIQSERVSWVGWLPREGAVRGSLPVFGVSANYVIVTGRALGGT